MTKQMVEDETYSDIAEYETLRDIKLALDELINTYGENARLILDSGYSSLDVRVKYYREETEQEYQKRLKSEARERDLIVTKEDKERKEWERLNKKFGVNK
jgi:hypothetical protein